MTDHRRAVRRYRALLHLLPRAFRDEAAADLVDVFRDGYILAARDGQRGAFWCRAVMDLLVVAAAEWRATLPRVGRVSMRGVFHVTGDFAVAARRLRRTPLWTAGAAATLALGLGAALVAVVLVRDVLLRPLPFPNADRLVRLREVSEDGAYWWPSYPNAAEWRDQARVFDGVGIADIPRVTPVLLRGTAVRVPVSRAAGGFFETLRVSPLAGRLFAPDDNRPGAEPVALVSERFWRGSLGAASPGSVILTIGTDRYTVVGVLPRDFRFLGDGAAWTDPADVWTPMERDEHLGVRTSHGYHVVARLAAGVTIDRARVEMNDLARRLDAQHREPTQAKSVQLVPLQDVVVGKAREPLRLLLYAALGVLLVACLNLAAALLSLGLERTRELSVRLALGATRGALARLLVIEAQLLAIPATVIGVVLAGAALAALQHLPQGTLPRLDETHLDAGLVMLTLLLGIGTATVSAVIPAVVLCRRDFADRLRTHGATTGTRAHQRLWSGFVFAQAALTMALLIGTGLLVHSFVRAMDVDLGYDATRVLAVDVGLPASFGEPARKVTFYDTALTALRATPGVAAAGLANVLPDATSVVTADTAREDSHDHAMLFAGYRIVDAGYFHAMGISWLRGTADAFRAGGAAIDSTLQRKLWPGADALGARVRNSFSDRVLTVAAVVSPVREWNQDSDPYPAVYVDYHHRPDALDAMHFVVRYQGSEAAAVQGVRAAVAAADPMVPVTIEPLAARVTRSLGDRRLFVLIAAAFGLVTLLLSAAGVHAMVAFVVARQRREAAIRLALGARPRMVVARTFAQGLTPAALGMVAGVLLALPLGRAMRAELFHVGPIDPAVVGAALLVVAIAAAVASVIPARRMARVDPASALRQD